MNSTVLVLSNIEDGSVSQSPLQQQPKQRHQQRQMHQPAPTAKAEKTRIAIATSVTQCPNVTLYRTWLLDTAAVLGHSIHLVAQKSKYAYDLLAFVHPDARNCTEAMETAGFRVLLRDTPIDPAQIRNPTYRDQMMESGCCGEKEFLKLYAYTLHEYPVVLHMDMDMVVLRPYDHIIDAFLAPDDTPKIVPDAMWPEDRGRTDRVGIAFTHDYSTAPAGKRQYEYNIQGGFLIVRPNQTTFDELKAIVLKGNFNDGWYDRSLKLKHRRWYGGETIQGLLAFYYRAYQAPQALELDRCVHNAMSEPSHDKWGNCFSITNFTTAECHTDCQTMNLSDIYSIHYTNCGKSVRFRRVYRAYEVTFCLNCMCVLSPGCLLVSPYTVLVLSSGSFSMEQACCGKGAALFGFSRGMVSATKFARCAPRDCGPC